MGIIAVYLFEEGGLKRWHGILVYMAGGFIVEGNWFAVARLPLLPIAYGAAVATVHGLPCRVGGYRVG